MSGVRVPDLVARPSASEQAFDLLGHEIAGEMASALGRAGGQVQTTIAALEATPADDPARQEALRAAARAVHAYFIQRELCGMRRHDAVIREYRIPRAVLVRLGAA